MPKVVQINSFNGGSTGRIAKLINERALAAGWETWFFYGRNWGLLGGDGVKLSSDLWIWIHVVFARLFDCSGLMSRITTYKLVRKLKKINPDIIHLHNIHGYYLNYRILFSYLKESQVKVVWTLHDCWPFTGHCSHFALVGCDKWKSECGKCPQLGEYPKSLACDASSRNYKLKRESFTSISDRLSLVPVSHWMNDLLGSSFLKENCSCVIHNGVDLQKAFVPRDGTAMRKKYNLEDKIVLLGVASPWSVRKGADDFRSLAGLLSKDRYAIVMIGVDDSVSGRYPDGIIALPKTHSVEELSQWYSAADIFLNLTYEDNFPTTNLEALACGTPVITYRTGGSPESVSSSTGIVVEQGNMEGLLEAVRKISSEGKYRYSDECRKRAIEHFDKDICFEKYLDLYKRIFE